MPLPLPPFMRKKMAPKIPGTQMPGQGQPEEVGEDPLGEPSASDAPEMKGGKPNPLKAWAAAKLMGAKR